MTRSCGCGGSTWGRATRPLWTEEELALYVAARRRKSARLDSDPGAPLRGAGAGAGASTAPAALAAAASESGGSDSDAAAGGRSGLDGGPASDSD